jgi:nucleotide-binding universal stress UspA family protein
LTFQRILVATDFSPASRPAFRVALDLARREGRRLTIVHVLPSVAPLGVEVYISARMYDEMEKSLRRWTQRRLDSLVAQARRAGVTARALLLSGAAAHEAISRAARDARADVIVIGTHGRTGLERVLVGSVAARVIGTAPCPVLTVRARKR